ncbi:MAG: hypothetical protein ACI8PT_001199 [Gammaproteobacteria bacterium]|jgi:hypothetical protein
MNFESGGHMEIADFIGWVRTPHFSIHWYMAPGRLRRRHWAKWKIVHWVGIIRARVTQHTTSHCAAPPEGGDVSRPRRLAKDLPRNNSPDSAAAGHCQRRCSAVEYGRILASRALLAAPIHTLGLGRVISRQTLTQFMRGRGHDATNTGWNSFKRIA